MEVTEHSDFATLQHLSSNAIQNETANAKIMEMHQEVFVIVVCSLNFYFFVRNCYITLAGIKTSQYSSLFTLLLLLVPAVSWLLLRVWISTIYLLG